MAGVLYFVLVKSNAFCYIRKHQEKNSHRPAGYCHREQTDNTSSLKLECTNSLHKIGIPCQRRDCLRGVAAHQVCDMAL